MKSVYKPLLAIFFYSFGIWLSTSYSFSQKQTVNPEILNFYKKNDLAGSFSLYDLKKDLYTLSSAEGFKKDYSPASTFKILNSLIGLETGIIKDENHLFKWDGKEKGLPQWNQDHTLKSAFQNSVVWYYQELARRVGGKDMKYWLDQVKYGNTDTTGGIDQFWLSGGLKISPEQQLDFLRRLYNNHLPFSQHNMEIVKEIMIKEAKKDYTIRSKTGMINNKVSNEGWYVGYVEKKGNVYFFANYMLDQDNRKDDFFAKRIEISNEILKYLNVIK